MERLEYRIIREEELTRIVGLSASTILRKEKEGLFPKRVHLGARAVGWILGEVYKWLDQQTIAKGRANEVPLKSLEKHFDETIA